MRDSKLGLLPKYRKLFGSNTLMYFCLVGSEMCIRDRSRTIRRSG